jgi:hypothetical protein
MACHKVIPGYVHAMSTVAEIEAAIEKLPAAEQRELARWLEERLLQDESPEMLAALDEGIRSLEEKGAREFTRAELEQKVRRWAGVSL